jgi:cysteine synthase A
MLTLAPGALAAIGGTPLVQLQKLVPAGSARVLVKLESANPTGSMKDRMAAAVIEAAERSGRLSPDGVVVEYTGGTTGVSLAFVCAAKGYRSEIVFSDAFSREKGQMMRALGARVTIVPSEGRGIVESLIRRMIEAARTLGERPGSFWVDQLNNHDAIDGYDSLGQEIADQAGGAVDAFVHAVGSAHALHGAARALRRRHPALHVVAVEPAESAVLAGGPAGAHQIDGIGIGFVPPLWRPEEVSELMSVPTAEAKAMVRRLAREEGLLAGTSSGANVVAALRLAARLGPEATVATLVVDSGLRYLSTDLFADS